MLTDEQKKEILQLIDDEKERLGSYRAVAVKCGISEASISQIRAGKYGAEGDDMLTRIGIACGYNFAKSWKIARDITNFVMVSDVLADAKEESMFMGIAEKAGAGKTETAEWFLNEYRKNCVFMISAKEWTGRAFLLKVATEIGAELPHGYASVNSIIESISATFNRMAMYKPLLIVDQANSLKSSALRTFIHLYNECEDVLGVVILGTEALEYEIKKGIRLNKTGYDEFDSRFGRKYIHLAGATLADCRKICNANGVIDLNTQNRIFDECAPVRKEITIEDKSRMISVVEDLRRIKRLVKREIIKIRYNHGNK